LIGGLFAGKNKVFEAREINIQDIKKR